MIDAKRRASDLAVLGGPPAFERPLPVGQLYFPSWDRFERAVRDLLSRRGASHGALTASLEEQLAAFFGVRHVVMVTNATLGLAMGAAALRLRGKVVLPSFTFVASAQALTWAGVDPVFCDVDPVSHQVTPATVEAALDDEVSAVLAVNLWGGTCGPRALEDFARARDLRLVFDSAHGAGVHADGAPLGRFGDLEVFSLHATKVLSATEGGCICTDDDELADRLRRMRGPGAGELPVGGRTGAHATFSDAQAAVGLLSLAAFPEIRANNERLFRRYEEALTGIPGITMLAPVGAERSNYQSVVLQIDEAALGLSRDGLVGALHAENVVARRYFNPGVHRMVPYRDEPRRRTLALPVTERLCATLVQLPIGALVTDETVERIASLVRALRRYAPKLTEAAA